MAPEPTVSRYWFGDLAFLAALDHEREGWRGNPPQLASQPSLPLMGKGTTQAM
jgi:hypothetical protein